MGEALHPAYPAHAGVALNCSTNPSAHAGKCLWADDTPPDHMYQPWSSRSGRILNQHHVDCAGRQVIIGEQLQERMVSRMWRVLSSTCRLMSYNLRYMRDPGRYMTGETLGFTAPLVYNPAISCHLAMAVPDVFSRIAEPLGWHDPAYRVPSRSASIGLLSLARDA
jgi:hypothetical protein